MDASEAFQRVFYSEFFFFERRDPAFIPIGAGHFGGDDFFEFTMLIGQMVDLCFWRHAFTSSVGPEN